MLKKLFPNSRKPNERRFNFSLFQPQRSSYMISPVSRNHSAIKPQRDGTVLGNCGPFLFLDWMSYDSSPWDILARTRGNGRPIIVEVYRLFTPAYRRHVANLLLSREAFLGLVLNGRNNYSYNPSNIPSKLCECAALHWACAAKPLFPPICSRLELCTHGEEALCSALEN